MTETSLMNEKYTQLCSEKCKLLNSIESASRESKKIKKEICTILDLIGEIKTDEELLGLESDSDSEMTSDPFYESFLNSTSSKNELEKVRKIHLKIHENYQKTEKKPKRKSPKKAKLADSAITEPNEKTEFVKESLDSNSI